MGHQSVTIGDKSTDENDLKEQEDLARAIELSLKDVKLHSPAAAPATAATTATSATDIPPGSARAVRALYDFEAAEDNELTFHTGDLIHVLDDSDPNWWHGRNDAGAGLFPSNFVTGDLSLPPELLPSQQDKSTVGDNNVSRSVNETATAATAVDIDEAKIDRLLYLLGEANTEDAAHDSDEMLQLEVLADRMQPLIDTQLEHVDRTLAMLTKQSADLVDGVNMYHALMRDAPVVGDSMFSNNPRFQQQMPQFHAVALDSGANPMQQHPTMYAQYDGGATMANQWAQQQPYADVMGQPLATTMTTMSTGDASANHNIPPMQHQQYY